MPAFSVDGTIPRTYIGAIIGPEKTAYEGALMFLLVQLNDQWPVKTISC